MIKQVDKSNQILVRLRSKDENWKPSVFGIITVYDQWLETIDKACTILEQADINTASMQILTGSLFCIETDDDHFFNDKKTDYLIDKLEEFPVPCFVEADLKKLPHFRTDGTWTKVYDRDCIYLHGNAKYTSTEIEIADSLTLKFLQNGKQLH